MQNNLLNLASIAPMAILGGFALLMLAVSLFVRTLSYKFYAVITILALALGFGLVFGYNSGIRGLFDVMLVDGIATLSMLIMLAGSIFFIFLSLGARSGPAHKRLLPHHLSTGHCPFLGHDDVPKALWSGCS